ncbi:MAG: TonB C-terminal domain-containing protein [Elusimicrobia bacterium]|nr:TonB C-terminal domain-containing protein [Elusimicrobiota bacterium]
MPSSGRKKNYYTVDLSIGSTAPRTASSGLSGGPANVLVPQESEDFLKTPSKAKTKDKPVAVPKTTAMKAAPGPKSAKSLVGLGTGAGNFPYPFYLEALRSKIALNWDPSFWRSGLLVRQAQVAFTINRDGTVTKPELTERSGDAMFDQACVRSVMLAAPFQPLPQGLKQDQLKIVFDFAVAEE